MWFKGELPGRQEGTAGDHHLPLAIVCESHRSRLWKDGAGMQPRRCSKEGVKIYSLSKAANPPEDGVFNASKVAYNTVHVKRL